VIRRRANRWEGHRRAVHGWIARGGGLHSKKQKKHDRDEGSVQRRMEGGPQEETMPFKGTTELELTGEEGGKK